MDEKQKAWLSIEEMTRENWMPGRREYAFFQPKM